MPSIEPDATAGHPVDGQAGSRVGAPSPIEAWQLPEGAPPFIRHPFLFIRWLVVHHRGTVEDNPIYSRTVGRRYVRRRRRLPLFLGDLLKGLVFAALAMTAIHLLRHMHGDSDPERVWLYFGPTVGAIYLVSLILSGFTTTRRASGFIKSTDRSMMWEDLILTPLREEHFLWGWLWSPVLDRGRHALLAVGVGTVGVLVSPFSNGLVEGGSVTGVWHLVLLPLSVAMMAVLGLALAAGLATLGLVQALDLGPRMYDAAGALWGLFHLCPYVLAGGFELAAGGFLIAGLIGDPGWMVDSILFALAGLVLAGWADWLLIHYLLPGFWEALLARRTARGQTSWWRALMGK